MTAHMTLLRPICSLVLLTGLMVLIWAGVMRPAAEWKADRFGVRAAAITERQRLGTAVVKLKNEYQQLSHKENLNLIWAGGELGEVTARVQAEISTSARSSGMALRSVTPSNAPDYPLVETVGFRLEGEARLDQLLTFLRAIEGASPALVIERTTLRRLNRVGEIAELPIVFIQLELTAPVRIGGGAVQ